MLGPPPLIAAWDRSRWRPSPWVVDGLMALGLVAVTIVATVTESHLDDVFAREVDAGYWFLVGLIAGPVVVRRVYPATAMVIAGAATTVAVGLDYPEPPASLALVILLFSCAVYARRDRAIATLVVTCLVVLFVAITLSNEVNGLFLALTNYLLFGVAWFLGDSVRYRRAYQAELEERARRLETDQEARAHEAVEEERRRLTRELHDVVAHGVSVMVVQAGAARSALGADRPEIGDALRSIETTGRAALGELRSVLAALRGPDGREELEPQPGLEQLDGLVRRCQQAGMDLTVDVGPLPPLTPGRELSVYRVVQEALTNVMRHAGPATVHVALHADDDLVVEVTDDGRGGAADPSDRPGLGLVGLGERLALYDGTLEHGPRTGGGWYVRARFPVPRRVAS